LVQLLAQLHAADALISDAMPDLDELIERRDKRRAQVWKKNLTNPLSIRFRILDPDRLLSRTQPLWSWVFTPIGWIIWLSLMLPAGVAALIHWPELTNNSVDQLLSASSLLTMLLVYPVVKLLHEFAHACAAKAFGAEVHDMGVMFLVFMPVPYVDASGSAAFASKWRRAVVAAAGMMMELLLGALALGLWLLIEPGFARSVLFSVMVIGGVSTLLFNGNPLLRFDGYYVLCDLIEIPNLAQRSNDHWKWLVRHHAFGLKTAAAVNATPGELRWLTAYAPVSFAYRIAISIGIALYLGQEFALIGLAIGLWSLTTLVVWPLIKGVHYLVSSPELVGRRHRPVGIVSLAVMALCVLTLLIPAPHSTYAEGVVWPDEDAQLRADEAGFVASVHVTTGQALRAGQPVALLVNDGLAVDVETSAAAETRTQRSFLAVLADRQSDNPISRTRVEAAVQALAHQQAQDKLAHSEDRLAKLVIVASRDGQAQIPRADDLPGKWLKKGDVIGHLVTHEPPTVRVVVTQDDIDLVRSRLERIEVRLAGDVGPEWQASVIREVPAGQDMVPSEALTLAGGGLIAADVSNPEQVRSLNRVFQFDLRLPVEARGCLIGERAHVRFVHGSEPLASQLARRARQLFLSRLSM
jgi:putative peptide zinc metalloprotease protein